jgi:hypothetical protein
VDCGLEHVFQPMPLPHSRTGRQLGDPSLSHQVFIFCRLPAAFPVKKMHEDKLLVLNKILKILI